MFSRGRIKRHAQTLGVSYESLKSRLDPLSRNFRDCCLAKDWDGCLQAIKGQNKLLQLYPNPIDYVQTDFDEDVALLSILEKVSPTAFELILKDYLSVHCERLGIDEVSMRA